MLLNLIQNGILDFSFAILGYPESALRNKRTLLDSLVSNETIPVSQFDSFFRRII